MTRNDYLSIYVAHDAEHKRNPRLIVAHRIRQAVSYTGLGWYIRKPTKFQVYTLARKGVELEYVPPQRHSTRGTGGRFASVGASTGAGA